MGASQADFSPEQSSSDQKRSARNAEVLARVGRSLLETIDLDEQLGLALNLAADALSADRGSILMADLETGLLTIRASEGLPRGATSSTPIGEGIAGWVAANNEPVILHGEFADSRFEGVDPTIGSSLSLPLSVEGKVLGVLNLVRQSGDQFTQNDLTFASSLADLASLAIEKARLYSVLQEREALVSDLLGAAIAAQEQERQRVAADIHDGFLQDLTAVFLKAESARMLLTRGKTDDARAAIDDVQTMVRNEVESLRDFIFEVRPPSLDEVGLAPTLRAMAERMTDRAPVECTFGVLDLGDRLPRAVETILYRVAQEALRNTVKHAGAKNVTISLERLRDDVVLTVIDDGVGMDPNLDRVRKPGHYGIDTMRERMELAGGTFHIGPHARGGTELKAVIHTDPGEAGN
jgi:signal transduction histidine kinase